MPGEDDTNEPEGTVVVAPSPDGEVNLSVTVTLNDLGYDENRVEFFGFGILLKLTPSYFRNE